MVVWGEMGRGDEIKNFGIMERGGRILRVQEKRIVLVRPEVRRC